MPLSGPGMVDEYFIENRTRCSRLRRSSIASIAPTAARGERFPDAAFAEASKRWSARATGQRVQMILSDPRRAAPRLDRKSARAPTTGDGEVSRGYIDLHAHMVSRTTDDYQQMAMSGCVAVTEPAFWAGYDRPGVDAFVDYFSRLTDFEPKRAAT